jgi:hypothetical protein
LVSWVDNVVSRRGQFACASANAAWTSAAVAVI